jgi:hypothetical protein
MLSGLWESSWGNGYNRLTVHHILLRQGLPSDFPLDGLECCHSLTNHHTPPHAMTKLTCPHCGHTFTAAELKALTKSVVHAYLQGIATSGEKLGSAMAATAKRASDATNARWKKYREEQAKHKEGK